MTTMRLVMLYSRFLPAVGMTDHKDGGNVGIVGGVAAHNPNIHFFLMMTVIPTEGRNPKQCASLLLIFHTFLRLFLLFKMRAATTNIPMFSFINQLFLPFKIRAVTTLLSIFLLWKVLLLPFKIGVATTL